MVLSLLNFTRDSFLVPLGMGAISQTFFFEVIDMIIMALAIGYIFSGIIRRPIAHDYDPLKFYEKKRGKWDDIKFGAMVAGGAVVLHELSHKLVAMAFGVKATLYAPYGFYLLVILLKAIGFPFLFFVGGFVVHGPLPALPNALVAIAGPLMNFILWFVAWYGVKKGLIKRKYFHFAVPFAKINLFLGVFNMLPLPGFDGFNFFRSLLALF